MRVIFDYLPREYFNMVSLNPAIDFVAKRKGFTFLGIDEDPQSDSIVITFNSSITLFQPNGNKVIKTWACTRGRKNTTTALFVPEEKEFVVVQNEKVLRVFKETECESAETFTLEHKIHALVKCHERNPLVMLETGSIHHLHSVLENPKQVIPDARINLKFDAIFYTSSFVQNGGKILVCSICVVKQEYHVLASLIHQEENDVQHYHKDMKFGKCKLLAATAYHNSGNPVIVTLWNDGSICLVRVELENNEKLCVQVDKIACVEIDAHSSITAISENAIAVLCKGPSILIVDLKFGTVQCRESVSGDKMQLSTVRNYIILDKSGQLQEMPFTTSPVTLASAILKQKHTRERNRPVDHATWTAEPVQNLMLSDEDTTRIEAMMKTKQETNFDKSWTSFWKGKSQDFRERFVATDSMRIILSRFGVEETQNDFWPRSTISKIINSELINGRWCNGIIRRALNEKDWSLVLDCLQHLNDISEEIMILCITHIAGSSKPDITNGTIHDEDEPNIPQQFSSCLNQIIQLPYSENLLRTQLQSLPFHAVMNLLQYLSAQLQELTLASSKPSLEQVISWLNMLLDTHLSEIIMLEKSWSSISHLHEAVKMQSMLFREISSVDMLLSQIESKLIPWKKSKDFMYSVQIMEF